MALFTFPQDTKKFQRNADLANSLKKRETHLFKLLLETVIAERNPQRLQEQWNFFQKNWRTNSIEMIKVTSGIDQVSEDHLKQFVSHSDLLPWTRIIEEYIRVIDNISKKISKTGLSFAQAESNPKYHGLFLSLRDLHLRLLGKKRQMKELAVELEDE